MFPGNVQKVSKLPKTEKSKLHPIHGVWPSFSYVRWQTKFVDHTIIIPARPRHSFTHCTPVPVYNHPSNNRFPYITQL